MVPLRMLGPVILMFLLHGAESSCPPGANPLTLEPATVLGQYGQSVEVNCSSMIEDLDALYWRHGNTSFDSDDLPFVEASVTLSDWDVTAECIIQLNSSHTCREDLEIIVFKNPDAVNLRPTDNVAAVEGTPYVLQCDVISVAPVQHLTVTWYKDNQTIGTDRFNDTTKTPLNPSSKLTVNMSREENGAQFRCEAQLDFGPNGLQDPVISNVHHVPVHYAPELKNNTEDVFAVQGDDVTLNCEAEANPPPVFSWTSGGNTTYLNITQVKTSATYNCTATNYLGTITKQIHVHVPEMAPRTSPAPLTTIQEPRKGCPLTLSSTEVVVRFGDNVSIDCSTTATGFYMLNWEIPVGGIARPAADVVTWVAQKLDEWTMEPKCFITEKDNTQCYVMPNITLYKIPDSVTVSAEDPRPMLEGVEYLLKCEIVHVAPVQKLTVKWYKGNETLATETFDNHTGKGPQTVTSPLKITPDKNDNGAPFRCEAELHLGQRAEDIQTKTSPIYKPVVHYKPQIQNCPLNYTGSENYFMLNMVPCHVDGNPQHTVQWYFKEQEISVSEILNRTHSGTYTAEFTNELGNLSTSVDITIEYTPSLTCMDQYEVEEGGELKNMCETEGVPAPAIAWLKDGKQMATQHRWKKDDTGTYTLTATNKHGAFNRTLHVDVLYVPVIKQENRSLEVTPGENVTFECSAEGNPVPKVQWEKNTVIMRNTTWERQSNMSVTGATSTHAGVYICVATNKLGSATRSVSLNVKDTSAPPREGTYWWLVIVLCLIPVVLIIIIYIFRNRYRKYGHYSFVPGNSNGPAIPLTAKPDKKV